MDRSIIHLNVADFAVAVERAVDCRLKDRPVIIAPEGAARAHLQNRLRHDMGETVPNLVKLILLLLITAVFEISHRFLPLFATLFLPDFYRPKKTPVALPPGVFAEAAPRLEVPL